MSMKNIPNNMQFLHVYSSIPFTFSDGFGHDYNYPAGFYEFDLMPALEKKVNPLITDDARVIYADSVIALRNCFPRSESVAIDDLTAYLKEHVQRDPFRKVMRNIAEEGYKYYDTLALDDSKGKYHIHLKLKLTGDKAFNSFYLSFHNNILPAICYKDSVYFRLYENDSYTLNTGVYDFYFVIEKVSTDQLIAPSWELADEGVFQKIEILEYNIV